MLLLEFGGTGAGTAAVALAAVAAVAAAAVAATPAGVLNPGENCKLKDFSNGFTSVFNSAIGSFVPLTRYLELAGLERERGMGGA